MFIDFFLVPRQKCRQLKRYMYFYDQAAVSLTATYTTFMPMEILFGRDLKVELYRNKIAIRDNVEGFFNLDSSNGKQ